MLIYSKSIGANFNCTGCALIWLLGVCEVREVRKRTIRNSPNVLDAEVQLLYTRLQPHAFSQDMSIINTSTSLSRVCGVRQEQTRSGRDGCRWCSNRKTPGRFPSFVLPAMQREKVREGHRSYRETQNRSFLCLGWLRESREYQEWGW